MAYGKVEKKEFEILHNVLVTDFQTFTAKTGKVYKKVKTEKTADMWVIAFDDAVTDKCRVSIVCDYGAKYGDFHSMRAVFCNE